MDCDQALALLVADMDRELTNPDRERLREHLQACAGCGETANALREQDAVLRRAFAPYRRSGAAVAQRVLAELHRGERIRRRRPWMSMALAAAAGFLLAMLLFRPWSQGPASPQTPPGDASQPLVQGDSSNNSSPTGQSPPPPEKLVLSYATKAVDVLTPQSIKWYACPSGEAVPVGSCVRTGPAVRCELRTPDGSEVRLNGDTEVRVTTDRTIDLKKGQILARVSKAESRFQVHIPEAVVTALGTEFDILCGPHESILTVLEGRTQVSGSGEDTVVEPRERVHIVQGRIKGRAPVDDLMHATSWATELLLLKGRDNKELEKRVNDLLAQIGRTKADFLHETDIRALGDHCVLPLTRYVQSERSQEDVGKRRMAARILADLAQPWSIGDLIELLNDADGEVRHQAARGLARLTQETQGVPANRWAGADSPELVSARQHWRDWWKANRQRFPSAPR
jgi:ferric-dicitrate binding protein FerR (iron transport regulator)